MSGGNALISIDAALGRPEGEHGPNETAVRELIDTLDATGALVGKWKALSATLLQTAQAVDRGMRFAKVSVATAQLNKMLLEGLEQMPEPRGLGASEYDALDEIVTALIRESVEESRAAHEPA